MLRSASSSRTRVSISTSPRAVTRFGCSLMARSGSGSVSWSDSLTNARLTTNIMRSATVDLNLTGQVRCACRGPLFLEGARIMKKLKHEAELYKAALQAGIVYAEQRGAVIFEPTDSASQKALYVYRLLVHDKKIQPMPEEQVAEK